MSARNNGHGRPGAARQDRRNRTIAIIVVLAIVLGAFGVGYALTAGGNDGEPTPVSTGASPSELPTPSPEPNQEPSEEPGETVTPEPPADQLPEGRHFVYATSVSADGELTFDLAYFLTDEAAQEAAAADGEEVTNGYYIVNDNPRLRTMPLAADAIVRYVPEGTCCNLKAGNLKAWSEAVNGTAKTDYPPMDHTGWWIGVEGGDIVRIAQQWVP